MARECEFEVLNMSVQICDKTQKTLDKALKKEKLDIREYVCKCFNELLKKKRGHKCQIMPDYSDEELYKSTPFESRFPYDPDGDLPF